MAFRRRSSRGGRGRPAPHRLLEKLRAQKQLGLRDVSPLERPQGAPDDVELATAQRRERRVAIVASRHDGPDLLGWGRLAAGLAGHTVEEILIACPLFGAATRRLAAVSGPGPRLRLVSVPALADSPDALLDEDGAESQNTWRPTSGVLLDRVLRVLEGAAIASGTAAVRESAQGGVLYVRGVRVMEVSPEGDGVGVECFEPERRRVHVSESNLSRWGIELPELVLKLGQDRRLLDRDEARRDIASDDVAAAVGVRITSRWLPWTVDGVDPVDWVGVDEKGRAVVGVQRASLGLSNVPAILTACQRVVAERERWAPGSAGAVRVVVASDDLDANVLELLESLGIDLEARPLGPAGGEDSDRAGRRRPRRRRRPRGGEGRGEYQDTESLPRTTDATTTDASATDAAPAEAAQQDVAMEDAEPSRGRSRRGRRRRSGGMSETEGASEDSGAAEEALEEVGSAAFSSLEGSGALAEAEPDDDIERDEAPEEARLDAERGDAIPDNESDERDETEEPIDPVELEIEATLAEEPGETEEEPEVIEIEKPRPRRQRAAIAVHNDPDSVLAALVLARERRHIEFFWVGGQEELMDFFRGKATDLPENADLLLVGFSAQPLPRETIATAELYSDRLQWFDHHEWAIEDLESLRAAIGADSICISEHAAGPLVPVLDITERRSRFTDKLVDLSARRLSENDMEKWGYRLVALIDRMRERSGDFRNEIGPVLSGKPTELPEGEGAYREEAAWLDANDPRLVHFGEYQMAVMQVPESLDAGEIARRARLKTGARLSLSTRSGARTILVACNDEKRHINVMGLVEAVANRHSWTRSTPGGDRVGRLEVDDLAEHPERMEAVIGDIVRHKSILYG